MPHADKRDWLNITVHNGQTNKESPIPHPLSSKFECLLDNDGQTQARVATLTDAFTGEGEQAKGARGQFSYSKSISFQFGKTIFHISISPLPQ